MESTSRTLVCSVLFLDIVEYSKKPVAEQLQLKQALQPRSWPRRSSRWRRATASSSTPATAPRSPSWATRRTRCSPPWRCATCAAPVPVRLGVNLGPVRLVKDLNGQLNIIGDGINVAQRVMSFAGPASCWCRARSTRWCRACRATTRSFPPRGARTDKHVREHEVYAVVGGTPHRAPRAGDRVARRSAGRAASAGSPARARSACAAPRLLAAPLLFAFIVRRRGARRDGPRAAEPDAAAPAPGRRAPNRHRARVEARRPRRPSMASTAAPAVEARAGAKRNAGAEKARREWPSRAAQAAAAAGRAGRVELAVLPWGEVFVDGKSRGVSPPLRELEIPPGSHTIEIRNSTSRPRRAGRRQGGRAMKIRHRFK